MSDYSEGACREILDMMEETNCMQHTGYGMDELCEEARGLIRTLADAPQAAVHFLVGGTQTNRTVIAAALRPYEAVIAADTGHINVHETGAIENSGHKVIAVPNREGKLLPEEIEKAVLAHTDEHMVRPAMVYLSNATELGTIYQKEELQAVSAVCRKYGLKLFMDGARLGSALTCEANDMTMKDLARLCDVFYIGGTKNGALFGEAVVIMDPKLDDNFRYFIKQNGGMLAKGWLLGIQFAGLFRDDTFFRLARHANLEAEKIRQGLRRYNIPVLTESPTNQIFPILEDTKLQELEKEFAFTFWEKTDETHTAVRIVTSWATRTEDVEKLLEKLG